MFVIFKEIFIKKQIIKNKMRKEVENWWKQAKRDLQTANNSLNSGDYYASAFWSQQAVEKSLKAVFLIVKNVHPSPSHSLIYLASEIDLDKKYFQFLRELTPAYINTRYPDIADALPSEIYDEVKAADLFKKAKEILLWLEKKYQKKQ